MRHPELVSLVGLRDSDGDKLVLVRSERPDGTRGYTLRVGTGKVLLTAADLARLGTVIRSELAASSQMQFIARAIALVLMLALVWMLASGTVEPLFAYPWSN